MDVALARPPPQARRRGGHRPLRRARRVDRRRRRRELRVRAADRGHRPDRGVAPRRAAPLRDSRRRRDRRLEARAEPVRRGRREAARGARRSRGGRRREREPLRVGAARGRERDVAARVRPGARDARRPRRHRRTRHGALRRDPRQPQHVLLSRDGRRADAARPARPLAGDGRRAPRAARSSRGVRRRPRSRTSSSRATTSRRSAGRRPSPEDATRSRRSTSTAAPACLVALVERDDFGERELALLGGLAQQAKLAIANASSYEGLERTFVSTVEALANALEANDEYTSTHARWITDLSLRVGRELGLDERALKRLELGALLHDIGKIGIPSDVLSKPGRLTAAERKLVQTHPELGERIIAPIDRLQAVRPIVRHCHERWDGARLPRRHRRRGHPARVADHLRLRRVPRDDDRPAVPAPPQPPRGGAPARGRRGQPVRSARRRGRAARPRAGTRRELAGGRELRLAALERVREPAERAVDREQLALAAALDDLPVLDDEDLVGAPDGRQAVGDDDRRAALAGAGRARARSAPRSGGRCSRSPRRGRGCAGRRAAPARSRSAAARRPTGRRRPRAPRGRGRPRAAPPRGRRRPPRPPPRPPRPSRPASRSGCSRRSCR